MGIKKTKIIVFHDLLSNKLFNDLDTELFILSTLMRLSRQKYQHSLSIVLRSGWQVLIGLISFCPRGSAPTQADV